MANFYSQYYTLSTDGTNYVPEAPQNTRPGEIVVLRAQVSLPATALTGDVLYLAPVVAGVRPIYGQLDATASNSSLVSEIGWTSDQNAIVTTVAQFKTATSTLLTPAQIAAVAGVSEEGDDLIVTLTGDGGTATVLTVLLALVNCGS